jgi:hypothetical protein
VLRRRGRHSCCLLPRLSRKVRAFPHDRIVFRYGTPTPLPWNGCFGTNDGQYAHTHVCIRSKNVRTSYLVRTPTHPSRNGKGSLRPGHVFSSIHSSQQRVYLINLVNRELTKNLDPTGQAQFRSPRGGWVFTGPTCFVHCLNYTCATSPSGRIRDVHGAHGSSLYTNMHGTT